MKVLLISPQPFFVERGTPLNVKTIVESLSSLGYEVDLLAYPIGDDLDIKNVKIERGYNFFGIKKIGAGPSLKKILLDFTLFFKACVLVIKNKYSVYHGIEEGAFIAGTFGLLTKTPYIVDIDSAMCEQLKESGFIENRLMLKIFSSIENFFLFRSSSVLTVCSSLTKKIEKLNIKAPIHQIEDIPVDSSNDVNENRVLELKKEFNLEGKKVIVYTGNFQSYQGLDFFIESLKVLYERELSKKDIRVLMVGGEGLEDPLLLEYKKKILESRLDDYVYFSGPMPVSEMGNVMALADVLVSPRIDGENTPLKIYSYMASKKVIVATNLKTHNQVLNSSNSILANPDKESFSSALLKGLNTEDKENADMLKKISNASKELVKKRYSKEGFKKRIGVLYDEILKNV